MQASDEVYNDNLGAMMAKIHKMVKEAAEGANKAFEQSALVGKLRINELQPAKGEIGRYEHHSRRMSDLLDSKIGILVQQGCGCPRWLQSWPGWTVIRPVGYGWHAALCGACGQQG